MVILSSILFFMRILGVYMVILLALSSMLKAQTNLVPNYSFELNDSCPQLFGGVDPYCSLWFSPMCKMANLPSYPYSTYTWGSSDYYNDCTNYSYLGVPKNDCGYQYSKSGNAYVSIAYSNIGNQFIDYKE